MTSSSTVVVEGATAKTTTTTTAHSPNITQRPSIKNGCPGCLEKKNSSSSISSSSSNHPCNNNNNNNSNSNVTEEWTEANIIETVQLWDLTTNETRKLLALRDRLMTAENDYDYDGNDRGDDYDDPFCRKNNPFQVVRFLRSCCFDVDAAECMFRDMIHWRRTVVRVDEWIKNYEPPAELLQYYPGAILQGVGDYEGDPVYVGRLGVLDGEGLVKRFGKEAVLKHTLWMREQMTAGPWIHEHYETTSHQKQITVIEDLHGLGLHHVANRKLVALFGQVMEWDQKYYPEITKRVILIRAPPIFCALWQIVKHFFDPYFVQEMMIICGKNNYIETLAQYMDPEILPKELAPGLGEGKAVACMSPYFQGGKVPRQRRRSKQNK